MISNDNPIINDKLENPIILNDYEAEETVGVQIGALGHKLWVCVDGVCVLRVRSPKIELTDLREPKPTVVENSKRIGWKIV